MSVYSLNIDNKAYPVIEETETSLTVQVDYHIGVLILENFEQWFQSCKRNKAERFNEKNLIRHGRNTYSYLSKWGAWVVCGPWPDYVRKLVEEAISIGGFIAHASVATQWRYKRGFHRKMGELLTPHICREIPNWNGMKLERQNEIYKDISTLVLEFLNTSPDAVANPGFAIPLDTYSGTANVAKKTVKDEHSQYQPDAIELSFSESEYPNLEALDYWWQSIFTMWWKGFW